MFSQPDGTGKRAPAGGRKHAERAFALPVAMMVTLVVIVLGIAFIEIGRMDGVGATRDVQDMQALAAAEFGMARAMSMSQVLPWSSMTYNGSPLDWVWSSDPLYSGHQTCVLFSDVPVGDVYDSRYTVVVEDLSDYLPTSSHYRVHSFGTCGPRTHHVTMEALTQTFAAFGWLTDDEVDMYFFSTDVVDGWVHSNDQIHIFGTPVFTGEVHSAADSLDYWHGGPPQDLPDFQEGLFLDSPEIDIQSPLVAGHVVSVRTPAMQPTGIHLPPNDGRLYDVEFASDGTVTIQRMNAIGTWESVIANKALSTTNGAIYVEDTVQISGTLNGEVTIATPQGIDMNIIDDLVYAYPPKPKDAFDEDFDPFDPAFDDRLGLLSGGNIIVKKEWNDTWTKIVVMGSIVALNESFRNWFYDSVMEKELYVYGGMAQYVRGAVGTYGVGSAKGFVKYYRYDQRFLDDPPPYYPVVNYDYRGWQLNP